MQPCSIFIIKSLSSPGSCGLACSSSCTTDPSLLRRTDETKKKTPSLFLLRSECIIKRPQNGSKVFKVESLRRIFGFISLRTGSSEPASPCKQRFNPHRAPGSVLGSSALLCTCMVSFIAVFPFSL